MNERLLDTARRVARELDAIGADYRVIGGMAVHHHGWERSTKDLDLLVDEADYSRIREKLLESGFLPTAPRRKTLRDAVTGIEVDFLIAGVDRPGSSRAPVAFPSPGSLPAETGELPGKYVDLLHLIELKLFSAKYGRARERDSIDVVELLRRNPLPRESLDRLHPDVREVYAYWWKAAQVREDPDAPDYSVGPDYANLDEVSALLREGKVTPRQAVGMLRTEPAPGTAALASSPAPGVRVSRPGGGRSD